MDALHLKYFESNLKGLPHHYTEGDTSRMTLGLFCLSSMDLLSALSSNMIDRAGYIEWIYAQQYPGKSGGFRGGPFMGPFDESNIYDSPHITMTYSALLCLLILGDDLQRVNKSKIINSLKTLQKCNGRYLIVH
jgi:geranylgeranyl transferase type-1 subunit beta